MRWLLALWATMTGRDMGDTAGDRFAAVLDSSQERSDAAPTASEVLALFHLDSLDAAKHARCGGKSLCRVNALKRVDEDLDAWLALQLIGG